MAISLRLVSNKLIPVNQFVFTNRLGLFNQGKIKISCKSLFLIQFLSKRTIAGCSFVNVVRQYSYLDDISVSKMKEPDNCTKIDYKLNVFPSVAKESSIIRSQRKRKSIDNLICINGKLFLPSGVHVSPLLSDFQIQMILLSELKNNSSVPSPEPKKESQGKPSEAQLKRVNDILADSLSNLFIQSFDYSIYHKDIIFENNIRGTKHVGLYSYIKQVALLRTVGHFKFAYVNFDILKITMHPEDGTIKVRWRIRGVSGLKAFISFWRFKIWELKGTIEKEEEAWYDGFSIFFVEGDGLVHKHIADKMQPDSDEATQKPKVDTLGAKLALMLGLAPRELADYSFFLSSHKDFTLNRKDSDLMFPSKIE